MKIEYDILIESEAGGIKIDWGNHAGWINEYDKLLEGADRITLAPKDGVDLPIVSVELGEGKRWIVFSRVFGQVTSGKRVRLYAIGWQTTVGGANIKSITWVYPNGTIENSDIPTFWKHFL
jgi:hypothetical protein